MIKGSIQSVETMGLVDGPGIRFVVFLQGCKLRCLFCHNPETWNMEEKNMTTPEELIKKVKRYKNYFGDEGGITFSGGDPLCQPEFVLECLKLCQQEHIHTCLDTSGVGTKPELHEEILKYTDLVLLDIKHINNEKCIELTGAPNTNTLKFATYLSEHSIPMWIRQVIVPGVTDDHKDLVELKNFISTLKTVQKVEFLAYHDMGKYKWEKLGISYPLEGVRVATQEDVERAKKITGFN